MSDEDNLLGEDDGGGNDCLSFLVERPCGCTMTYKLYREHRHGWCAALVKYYLPDVIANMNDHICEKVKTGNPNGYGWGQ